MHASQLRPSPQTVANFANYGSFPADYAEQRYPGQVMHCRHLDRDYSTDGEGDHGVDVDGVVS